MEWHANCLHQKVQSVRIEGNDSMPLDRAIKNVYCSDFIDDVLPALFWAEYMPPATVVWITAAWSALPLSSSTISISDFNSRKTLFLKILRNYTTFRIMCQSYSFSDSVKESRNLNLKWFIWPKCENHCQEAANWTLI